MNQQIKIFYILATCFSYNEPSSSQKTEQSSGTFSDCALYINDMGSLRVLCLA